jgi:glycosyl transferase family 9 (putative heptosyltransferase)
VPRALLLFARRRGNPVGDTAAAARNFACLRAAFGEIALSVWSPDPALWSALCGTDVAYVPFPGDCVALDSVDLIVADCVQLDVELAAALDASGAAVLDLAPGLDFRWRLPGGAWHTLSLPADVDWSRRLIAVYGLLGVRITDEQTLLPPPRRGTGIYVNPYASTARKSLHPAFLRGVLARLAAAPDAVDVVCPAPPGDMEDVDSDAYAALAACVRDAARRSAHITVLPAMAVTEYVERIRSAGAVIGSDTSSQHVAALFGIPSIACYPPHARQSYYRSPGWNNLCLTTPEPERAAELQSLAALVAMLASAFARGMIAAPRTLPAATTLFDTLRAVARRELSVARAQPVVDAALDALRDVLPAPWQSHALGEARALVAEIMDSARADFATVDRHGNVRLDQGTALNVIAVLAAVRGDPAALPA